MKLTVITNGSPGGYLIADANVYIGHPKGDYVDMNTTTDINGEVEINSEDLKRGSVVRIRKSKDGFYVKPFECKAQKFRKVWTSKNPFSNFEGVVYLFRE